jgi:predicted transcriptional regulator
MLTTTRSLLERTAEDLMSRNVVTIPAQMSLRAAAHQLATAHVSGAPVTDDSGRCIGVLSATDVVRWLDRGEQPCRGPVPSAGCFCCDWGMIDIPTLPPDAVSRYMTTNVVTASRHAAIGQLAQWMLDAHIHRVLITDEQRRPVGIVSSTDILAAVAAEGGRQGPEAEEGD